MLGEMEALLAECGFKEAEHLGAEDMTKGLEEKDRVPGSFFLLDNCIFLYIIRII